MALMRLSDLELIQEAVHRFHKLIERSGLKRETRCRLYYEKPIEVRRRVGLRSECRAVNTHSLQK